MNGTIGVLTAADSSVVYDLYRWGIMIIKGIQTIESPVLTGIMKVLTALGTEVFYIPVILFVLWCVDEKQGFRLTVLILLSAWVNGFFKDLLKQPRPYDLDPGVGRAVETSYGIPSGHAQQSLVFWAAAAPWADAFFRPRRGSRLSPAWVIAGCFILIIPFTRLYLGVHFPTDIAAGWFLGGIILAVYYRLGAPIESFIALGGTRIQLVCAAGAALLMNAFGSDSSLGGMFFGFGAGYALLRKYVPFTARGPVRGRKPGFLILGTRYLLGIAGAALIYLGLRLLLPGESSLFAELPLWGIASPYYALGRFLRYGMLGLWASAGAPWLFRRLGLAGGPDTTAVPAG
jgi:membrane-associated phospholipid phosphatase